MVPKQAPAPAGRWKILASPSCGEPRYLDGQFTSREEAAEHLARRREEQPWYVPGCNFYLVDLDNPMA